MRRALPEERSNQGPIMEKRPALGKGLSALIPDVPEPRTFPTEIDIDRLSPNSFQPRAQMDEGTSYIAHEFTAMRPGQPYTVPVFAVITTTSKFWLDSRFIPDHPWVDRSTQRQSSTRHLRHAPNVSGSGPS